MKSRHRVIGLVLLALYLYFSASTHLFYHTHCFSWGNIVHSHLYAHTNHQHSQSECNLISYFALVSSAQILAKASFCLLPLVIIAVLSLPASVSEINACVRSFNLRAPPVPCR